MSTLVGCVQGQDFFYWTQQDIFSGITCQFRCKQSISLTTTIRRQVCQTKSDVFILEQFCVCHVFTYVCHVSADVYVVSTNVYLMCTDMYVVCLQMCMFYAYRYLAA